MCLWRCLVAVLPVFLSVYMAVNHGHGRQDVSKILSFKEISLKMPLQHPTTTLSDLVLPSGHSRNFDVDSMSNQRRYFDVDFSTFFRRQIKTVEISTSTRRQIDVEIFLCFSTLFRR